MKFLILCFLAVIAIAAGEDYGNNYGNDYKNSPRKVVYVEEREPDYKLIRREPNYKKTIYEYRKPEQKNVYVKVVQPAEERKVYLRPSYEPKNKDVVVKILDRKH